MPSTTVSSEEFEQSPGRVEEASRSGPVFITERGQPSFVLLSIEEYRRLTTPAVSLAEALADPKAPDVDFDPPRLNIVRTRLDLS
jgi:prevent-host-death family protein